MCRMSTLAAIALSLGLGSAWPTLAKAPPKLGPTTAAAIAPTERQVEKAGTADRTMASRLDPLARAAFWAREIEIDSRDAQAGVGLSQALRALGKYDDALEAAQRVVVVHPENVEGLLEVARAQIGRGQGFYAIEAGRQAQTLAPKDWRAPSLLGIAYEQAGREDEALSAHRQAVVLAPDSPAALTNLALFYASHGNAAQAESLLRSAMTKPGADIAVRQNLALVLGLQGRLDEAEKLARQDLPPEVVASNMAYLRTASGAGGGQRSWDSVRQSQ